MQLIRKASIFSMDGKRVGRMDRVVIHLKTQAVTHLVIHCGVLLTQDKVVPIDLVDVGEQDRLVLQLHAVQLAQMPDFGRIDYSAVNEDGLPSDEDCGPGLPPPTQWYPPYTAVGGRLYVEQPRMRGTRVNIPAGSVALKEGAKVISADGKHVGCVERVLTSPPGNRATYFQISKGWRRQERKLVPVEWMECWDEEHARLVVQARTIQDLPE